SFARRDAKELGIKQINLIQKSAVARVHFPGSAGIGIVESINVPTVSRNFAHGIASLAKELPEDLRIIASPGEAAAHSDNGHWLAVRLLHGVQPGLQLFQFQVRLLHRRKRTISIGVAAHSTSPSFVKGIPSHIACSLFKISFSTSSSERS